MTENEAETVLLTLGPVLEWRSGTETSTSGSTWDWHVAKTQEREYALVWWGPYKKFTAQVTVPGKDVDVHKRMGDENAMKIACERHFATGKWE